MYRELTNLLPESRRRAFKREYFIRLGVVSLLMLASVAGAGAVMLLPSYLSFTQDLRAREIELARIETALGESQESEVGARLVRLKEDTEHLKRLANRPSGSAAVRAVLDVPRPGIKISRIAFTPSSAQSGTRMVLSGTASTRDTLRRYNVALTALPFVERSDLPISTYAKETDLEFMITLTGSL